MITIAPCDRRLGLIRMGLCDAFQPRDKLIYPRVVLHRAAAQRIHPQINRVVPRRKPREVPDDFDLAQLRQRGLIFARRVAQQGGRVDFGHIQRSKLVALLAR